MISQNFDKSNTPANMGDNEEMELEMSLRSIWLGMRDSNPRSRDQNPMPYHLANPQYGIDYNEKSYKYPVITLVPTRWQSYT